MQTASSKESNQPRKSAYNMGKAARSAVWVSVHIHHGDGCSVAEVEEAAHTKHQSCSVCERHQFSLLALTDLAALTLY